MLGRKNSKDERANPALLIYSVVNLEYIQLGLGWGKRIKEICGKKPIFICSDAESFDILIAHGFPCIFEPPEVPLSADEKQRWTLKSFPSDNAIYTNALKWMAAEKFLESGHSVLYSDVDALWIRDPIPMVLQQNADFVFQPAFSREPKEHGWIFEICAGFFYLRPSYQTQLISELVVSNLFFGNESVINSKSSGLNLLEKISSRKPSIDTDIFMPVRPQKHGCDQNLLNRILRRFCPVEWSFAPTNWEHCSMENGWKKPVSGLCRKTNMNFCALPHTYFQRQRTDAKAIKHAIICHPKAGHTQAQKLEKFMSLGIDLLNS